MQIICALECENVLVWHCVLQRHLFQLYLTACIVVDVVPVQQ